MLEVKMEINNWDELKEQLWSGAKDRVSGIEDYGLEDTIMQWIEDCFCDEIPTIAQVNDLIWFDSDEYIKEIVGDMKPDDIDMILNYFKDNAKYAYNYISMEDDNKVLELAECFNTIDEFMEELDTYDSFDECWQEYLEDYASPETKAVGEKLIEAELNNIGSDKVREITKERLEKLDNISLVEHLLNLQQQCCHRFCQTSCRA